MGEESKVTVMVLKVDLGCSKCCRKIKRVLCSTPQIRNQLYDEKSNTVTVSVICCTPEKVADKIRSKAGGTVKGIDFKPSKPPAEKPKEGPPPQAEQLKQGPPPADKPKSAPPPADKPASPPADKPKSAAPPADKPKSDEKPKSAPPPADKPKSDEKPKSAPPPQQKPAGAVDGNSDKPEKPDIPPPQQQVPLPMGPPPQSAMKPNQPAAFISPESIPVAGYPSIFPPVVYYDGGPYYQNHEMSPRFPQQPIYQYDGYQGRPVGDSYGGGRAHQSAYFSDDNPSSCSVM